MNNIFWLYIVLTTEVWKDIPGYETYQASTFGNVRSKKNMKTLGGKLNRYGYKCINICLGKRGLQITCTVHRLICKTFYGESDLQVNHILGIKDFNYLWNLEYCTASNNLKHSYDIGIRLVNKRNSKGQFTGEFINAHPLP